MQSIDLAKIRVHDPDDIRNAAIYFRNYVYAAARLRIAASHNISARLPMIDASGTPLAISAFGWEEASDRWWEDIRFALHNPLSEACRIESRPFWANRSGAWNECGKRVLENFDFSYFEKICVNKASIVIPVHLAFGQVGLVTMSCNANNRDDLSAELAENCAEFLCLSHLFLADYMHLNLPNKWLPDACSLSRHEIKCLRWVARGKTDDEIATILDRARPTVRFHLQNAAVKLGAVNRSQAVFRAGQLGYLAPANAH